MTIVKAFKKYYGLYGVESAAALLVHSDLPPLPSFLEFNGHGC